MNPPRTVSDISREFETASRNLRSGTGFEIPFWRTVCTNLMTELNTLVGETRGVNRGG